METSRPEDANGRTAVVTVSNREEIIRMATRVKEELGVPDLIVNNAGAYYFQRLEDKDYDSWDRMIDLNILGYLLIIAEFLADMKVSQLIISAFHLPPVLRLVTVGP